MSTLMLSKRYAQSVFELAREQERLEAVKADMVLLQQTIKKNRQLKLLLFSPVVQVYKKIGIFTTIFEPYIDNLTLKFLTLLCQKHRENTLLEVTEVFLNHYNDFHGIQESTLTTATPVDSNLDGMFGFLINQISKTPKKPLIHKKVDPKIIGGFILTVGDKQLDLSVKNQLGNIKRTLLR